MKKLLVTALLFAGSQCSFANVASEILPFGVFHFANPGLDKVKTKVIDVSTPENQAYLNDLSSRIADGFKPTHILIECAKDKSEKVNKDFQSYLQGQHQLSINENEQLGFRVAKKASLNEVICYDEQEISWQSNAVFEEMPKLTPDIAGKVGEKIKNMTQEINKLHKTESLKGILQYNSDPEVEENNKSLYLLLNEVGAMGSYSGADSTASWWHRNFRMYANIQKYAQEGNRVLVIGGVGHMSIFKDLIKIDSERKAVDVKLFL